MDPRSEYLFISSSDSTEMFPSNNGANFRVLIPRHFSIEWEISLKELFIETDLKGVGKYISICCGQVVKSTYSNDQFGILRAVYLEKNKTHFEFKNTYYFKFVQYNIEYLHIYLIDEKGELANDLKCNLKCVLHCKRKV